MYKFSHLAFDRIKI